MKITHDDFKNDRFEDLYSFLEAHDSRWLITFFTGKEEFKDYLTDEDVHLLVYEDDSGQLCCVGILDEASILTVAFSSNEGMDKKAEIFLEDAEKQITDPNYISLYFGFGNYSYGVYDQENPHLHELMVRNGYVVEAAAYDIRYTEGSDKDTISLFVNQITAQKITVPFEVCGRYRSLSKDIK